MPDNITYVANERQAPIVQATDSKWLNWEKALTNEGITVCFICREDLERIRKRKQKA